MSLRLRPAGGCEHTLLNPPERYTLIDLADLSTSCGFTNIMDFQQAHRQWVDEALRASR